MLSRLAARLTSSTSGLRHGINGVGAYGRIDQGFWDTLEETLVSADLGPEASLRLCGDLRLEVERLGISDSRRAVEGLRQMLVTRLEWRPRGIRVEARPAVVVLVGVNGSGKTTSAAKLAARLKGGGGSVLLGAADTFRAGATTQLQVWGERIGCEVIVGQPGADPASVAFAAVSAGVARGVAAVVIDTAGRLHTQDDLMRELVKIQRSVGKAMEGAPHETLLTLDATIGQNSVRQAMVFSQALSVTGLLLAKLDGSARGGVILGLEERLGVPVKLVGTGEAVGDLEDFDPGAYVEALFEPAP